MFDNVKLITKEEDMKLYLFQSILIEKFEKNISVEILLQIALLQTLSPICDKESAIEIMKANMMNNFEFLVIGAYLSTECWSILENEFLDILIDNYKSLEVNQKSIVKYLEALNEYNKTKFDYENTLHNLTESISLDDELVSSYYLRYLITKNVQDKAKAIYNVKKVLELKDIEKLTLKDLTNPYKYIEEYITMRVISKEVYDIISYDS